MQIQLPDKARNSIVIYALASPMALANNFVSADEWDFSASFLSDYILDGVSQSNSQPALQVQGMYSFDSGIYASLWASSVDLDPYIPASLEVSYAVGINKALNSSLDLEVEVAQTEYRIHSRNKLVFQEAAVTASLKKNLSLQFSYSDDPVLFGKSKRVKLNYDIPIHSATFLTLETTYINDELTTGQNRHYKIGIRRKLENSILEFNYQNTDIERQFDPQGRASGRFSVGLTLTN